MSDKKKNQTSVNGLNHEKNINFSGNLIFFISLLLIAILLGITIVESGKQRENYRNDWIVNEEAKVLFEKGEYKQAAQKIETLLPKYPDSYILHYRYGLCLAGLGEIKKSLQHYETALNLNHYLVTDGPFLLQYGDFLLRDGQTEKAKAFLFAATKKDLTEELKEHAKKLYEQAKGSG